MSVSDKLKVGVIGGSGYTGGELLRLLAIHKKVEINFVTSGAYGGKKISAVHPNFRKVSEIRFCGRDEVKECDFLFLCTPHGVSMNHMPEFMKLAPKIVDLSGDFRLKNPEDYKKWYGVEHGNPELLKKAVYGIPELHREEIKNSNFVTGAGCNATAAILALYPLYKEGLVEQSVVDVKAGSSEGGNTPSLASHHPERSGAVRSFKPTMHRHTAEILQELGGDVHLSVTSIEMVRGILATCHAFLNRDLSEKEIWQVYRKFYADEPFIRIVKEKTGVYRYPEPKILLGSNYCDIGFEKDISSNRVVVVSAIDNMMKGAAGQAVQCMNLMMGWDETLGLEAFGFHPI